MDLTQAIETLLRWRITLSLICSIAAALALSNGFEWFTAKYALSVVIVSTAFGIVWAARAEDGVKHIATPRLSPPVEVLALSFFGVVAGGLMAEIIGGPFLATLVLAMCPTAIAIWRATVEHKKTSRSTIIVRTVALLSGWLIVLFILGGQSTAAL